MSPSPRFLRAESRARSIARRSHIPIGKARANVARSQSMRSYWTRARSYADKKGIGVREASRSAAFKRDEKLIKKGERGVAEGSSQRAEREAAEKLMRALERQGLRIGKGKDWRSYVRKRKRR